MIGQISLELAEIENDKDSYIEAYRILVGTRRVELQGLLVELRAAQQQNDVDLFFAKFQAALIVVFFAIALVATSELAIGGLLVYELLGATGVMGWQLYRSKSDAAPGIVVGYGAGRILFSAEIVGQKAKSIAGRAVGAAAKAVGIGLQAKELYDASSKDKALDYKLAGIVAELTAVDAQFENLGSNKPAWLMFRRNLLTANREGLIRFVEENEATNCLVVDVSTGPTIVKP